MEELRKDIPGYEGRYQVSNLGRVKSLAIKFKIASGRMSGKREKLLKPRKTGTSMHYRVSLKDDYGNNTKFQTSRLVYCVFNNIPLSNNKDGYFILHKNDISWDNRLENLYMGTQVENGLDRMRNTPFKKNMLLL